MEQKRKATIEGLGFRVQQAMNEFKGTWKLQFHFQALCTCGGHKRFY